MFFRDLQKIRVYVSGERAFQNIAKITTFHRIQASEGYRDAARMCAAYLRGEGLESELLSFAANERERNLQARMFQEWNCRSAWLELCSPHWERLCDFEATPISLIQKSAPADYRDTPLDLVDLDRGNDPAAYENLDLRGKVIFIHDWFQPYLGWAIKERGAVGIITDAIDRYDIVREEFELKDERQSLLFSWYDAADEVRPFGFVLSPRQGVELRRICRETASAHAADSSLPQYPQVHAYVDAAFCDGQFEDVTALLRGESEEEILISAHLCHPKPCANDNASGAAGAMEAIKALNDLIERGRLARPRRSIRLLLVPERTGSYALAEHYPALLTRSIGIAASFAYTLASLTPEDAAYFMNRSRAIFAGAVAEIFCTADEEGDSPSYVRSMVEYRIRVAQAALRDYERFFQGDELDKIRRMIADECAFLRKTASQMLARYFSLRGAPQDTPALQVTGDRLHKIPIRLVRGNLSSSAVLARMTPVQQEEFQELREKNRTFFGSCDKIILWVDGSRSIGEVALCAAMDESLRNPQEFAEFTDAYLHCLEKAGWIGFRA